MQLAQARMEQEHRAAVAVPGHQAERLVALLQALRAAQEQQAGAAAAAGEAARAALAPRGAIREVELQPAVRVQEQQLARRRMFM
jgi:hypothetical protein